MNDRAAEDRAGAPHDSLVEQLSRIVGTAQVERDPEVLRQLSLDLSLEPFTPAELAVVPRSAQEVGEIARVAAEAGWSLATRGAAMSYTRAHVPVKPATLLLDMRMLDRIRTVSARDGYVVAEAGVTWEQLYLELSDKGLRTPFWGPLSGRRATIGGTLSQNSVFFGSARYDSAGDSVLGLEIALPNGELLRTGGWAQQGGSPAIAHFGPTLTSAFIGDSGLLGIKTAAALRTIPEPTFVRACGFHCSDAEHALAVMEEVGRLGVASDVFAFDPFYHQLLASLGFEWIEARPWSVHAVVEGDDRQSVDRSLSRLRAAAPGAVRIDGSIALALRADPFGATQLMFSSIEAGVHLPVHAVVPFSLAAKASEVIEELEQRLALELERRGIRIWQLFTMMTRGIVLEPSLYFRGNYRDRTVNDDVTSYALALRRELATRLDAIGATHFQVARYYDFASRLEPAALDLLRSLKHSLDPGGRVGPGLLGV